MTGVAGVDEGVTEFWEPVNAWAACRAACADAFCNKNLFSMIEQCAWICGNELYSHQFEVIFLTLVSEVSHEIPIRLWVQFPLVTCVVVLITVLCGVNHHNYAFLFE